MTVHENKGRTIYMQFGPLNYDFFQVVCLKFYFPFIIYIFLKVEETITFAKLMESTGIVALGVHGR